MIPIFESILPIFMLIIAGNLLRRSPGINESAWPGLEQLGFWFLYPALLFRTILKADFSQFELGPMILALSIAVTIGMIGTYLLWPILRRFEIVAYSEFSTFYQTSVRWNGFIALAVAQEIFPPEASAVVALAMAAIVIPINFASVFVVTQFSSSDIDWNTIFRRIATNPLIISASAALLLRFLPSGLYGPFDVALDLVARAALGMGLVSIGAGLRPGDVVSMRAALWLPVILKLLVFPVIFVACGILLGVTGEQLVWLSLCAAVPTAMNGYLLAKQMGGDAELYAATVTVQTAVSFFTIPLVLETTRIISASI